MGSIDEVLVENGIVLPDWYKRDGNNTKVECPKCQPLRTKNVGDRPLSINVDDEAKSAVWNCHHCGYKGQVGEGNIKEKEGDSDGYTSKTFATRNKRGNCRKVRSKRLRISWY